MRLRTITAGLVLSMLVASTVHPRNGQKDEKDAPETLIKARQAFLDDLLAKRAQGELARFVKEQL